MNIIKQLKLRKLNKERECLLNEFTVEDITVQGVWSLKKKPEQRRQKSMSDGRLGKTGRKDQSNHGGIRT